MYLSHGGVFQPSHGNYSFFNQLNHPELVPFDLNLVLLRLLGLLAITVSACFDSFCIYVQRRTVKRLLVRVVACQ